MANLINKLHNFKKSNITKKYQNQFINIYEQNNLDLKYPKLKMIYIINSLMNRVF
jgi:hypothetical protein